MFREEEIERLDAIFVYELSSETRRLFANITRVLKHSDSTDDVLNIPVLRCTSERVMVGLPAVAAKKLYIVSVERRAHDNELRLGGNDMLLYCN